MREERDPDEVGVYGAEEDMASTSGVGEGDDDDDDDDTAAVAIIRK